MSLIDRTPSARAAALALAAALCYGLAVLAPTPAAAATTPCPAGTPVTSDFDGDGLADLVVGASLLPEPTSYASRPAEWIQPGDGGTPLWVTDSANLVSADLNGDTCADAILAPGQDFDERYGGLLKLVPGTPSGLDLAAGSLVAIPQADEECLDSTGDCSADLRMVGLRHDGFSQVVAAVTLRNEGDPSDAYLDVFTLDEAWTVVHTQVFDPGADLFSALASAGSTVAVGEPNAIVRGILSAGVVRLFTPDAADPQLLVQRLVLTQDSKGVPGKSEADDGFGGSLAFRDGRLAVSVPGESSTKTRYYGAVQPILWHESTRSYTAYRRIDQGTKGVPGSNEAGDQFGYELAIARGLTRGGSYDIVIGAGEDYGKLVNAGSVTVANFTKSIYRGYTQATKGIPGSPDEEDYFGSVLGVLATAPGVDTLLIGAPYEGTSAGYAIRSDGRRLGSGTRWTVIPVPSDAPGVVRFWGTSFGTNR